MTSYHVYGNGGSGPVDYGTVLATTASLTWATPALTAGGWVFAVRAFDTTSGLEEANVDCAVTIRIDAGLADITAIPMAPAGLSAVATVGGGCRVAWTYPHAAGGVEPTGFHVYKGIGTPNYAVVAATVAASSLYARSIAGQVRYSANLTGLADGTAYAIGVRAYSAAGEEANTVIVAVTGNVAAPGNVANLAAV